MDKQSTENRPDPSRPLPRRAPPHPDEDLLSILRRSASRMGYPDVRWLLRPAQGNWFLEETDITLLSAEEDYHALGRLLLLSREELHSHTLHRFARLLESSESTGQPPGQDHAPAHLPQMNPRLLRSALLEDAVDFLLPRAPGTIAREVSFVQSPYRCQPAIAIHLPALPARRLPLGRYCPAFP